MQIYDLESEYFGQSEVTAFGTVTKVSGILVLLESCLLSSINVNVTAVCNLL